MHWSEEIAQRIIDRNPDKPEYVCAAGISPSGSIHIGNFRDIATSWFVAKALIKKGKKATLLFSWDEFDRLRKIPKNVAEQVQGWEKYLGMPYSSVPDPFGCCESYAKHFENEFEESLKKFGIPVSFRYQTSQYLSGCYSDLIIQALKKRKEIFDILDSFRTQDAQEGERENYYPVSIFCPECGKDDASVVSLSEDCTKAEYKCKCGHCGTFDFTKDFNCKLAWKIDWPMRWKYEGVDFEPGGKDHASPNGSYQTSRIITKEVFDYEAPIFQGYEFIGIKGTTGKMSGSSGLNLTPATLLKIYQPEVILWLYSKTIPTKAFDFCFDDEILRQYFEFDKMLNAARADPPDETARDIMYNAMVPGREVVTVPMSHLASFGPIMDFKPELLETFFEKIGFNYKLADFAERLELAKYWVEQCSPESINRLLETNNWEYWDEMSENGKKEIELLADELRKADWSLDDLNTMIYSIPERVAGTMEPKVKKQAQSQFFKNVYRLLLGKDKGPRLYLFLHAIDKEKYLPLMEFTEDKRQACEAAKAAAAEQAAECAKASDESAEPVEIPPVKPEITIEDFQKLDLRVCRIVAAEPIKKSRSLLKLTLDDGMGGREIVSSIKDCYDCEKLVGRDIIVLVNLKPAKLGKVMSQGMLLAAAGEGHSCSLLMPDTDRPAGTIIT